MEQAQRWTPQRYLQLLVLILLALWTLWPLAYMLSTALKSTAEVTLNNAGLIPQHPTLGNFTQIFSDNQDPIGRWFLNSAVAVVGGACCTGSTTLATSHVMSVTRCANVRRGLDRGRPDPHARAPVPGNA